MSEHAHCFIINILFYLIALYWKYKAKRKIHITSKFGNGIVGIFFVTWEIIIVSFFITLGLLIGKLFWG